MNIVLRNSTGQLLRDHYPEGGAYDIPPGAWVVVEGGSSRAKHLIGLGCIPDSPAEGEALDHSSVVVGGSDDDSPVRNDPKSELGHADTNG